MKRSEMVRAISKYSYEYTGEDGDFAEGLLNLIEQAGMLPPESIECGSWVDSYGNLRGENEWEPEE